MMQTLNNTVTLSVASREDTNERALAAFHGEQRSAHISFSSVDLLWQTLTRKRWELLKVMAGAGPLSVREVARRVGRDVRRVHDDTQVLLNAGILDRTQDGQIEFGYDTVHVDFVLRATN